MTVQFLISHDEDGFKASLINGKGYTEDEATSAALVAATLQLTAKGIPVIYYGEEVSEEDAEKFTEEITELYPDVDVDIQFGGQPIYYYVLAVE